MSLLNEVFRKPETSAAGLSEQAQQEVGQTIHMDLTSDTDHLPMRVVATRAAAILRLSDRVHGIDGGDRADSDGGDCSSSSSCGSKGQERWKLTLIYAAVLAGSIYLVFDRFMSIPWPPTLLGQLFPALKFIPSV